MNSKTTKVIIAGSLFILPVIAFAQVPSFTPLVGIPGVTDGELNFSTYINTLYTLSISIAGLLAVIKIIIAGVKYMLSDVVTNKQEAIGDIKGALLGLLIVLAAVVVLNTINPQLTRSTLFLTPASEAPANNSPRATRSPLPTIQNGVGNLDTSGMGDI